MKSGTFLKNNSYISSTARGLISGVIGGLAGAAIKGLAEHFLSVREVADRSARIKVMDNLSTKITGLPISKQNEALTEQLVGLPIGASIGAAYGYGKRYKHEFNAIDGVILGSSTWISTHETSLPLLGLKKNPVDIPLNLQVNELLAHVLFGVTTELVRSSVNKRLQH